MGFIEGIPPLTALAIGFDEPKFAWETFSLS
jgi:hypothetical protein